MWFIVKRSLVVEQQVNQGQIFTTKLQRSYKNQVGEEGQEMTL